MTMVEKASMLFPSVIFFDHPRHPCFAGDRILCVDTSFDLYRCPAIDEQLKLVCDQNGGLTWVLQVLTG